MIICDIQEITPDAYAEHAQTFIAAMEEMGKAKTDSHFHEQAGKAANIAETYSPKIAGKRYAAFAKNGDVIYGLAGLMILSIKDAHVEVDYLCTHPLTSQCGVLLIKHAVQISKGHGKGGTLKLYDASRSSFYDNLGFLPIEKNSDNKVLMNGVFKERAL